MKIGLNTYSFRYEIEKEKSLNLEKVFKIADKIGEIEGIELLDRHIPGWNTGDKKIIADGVHKAVELARSYGLITYGLGPHLKIFRPKKLREKEINEFYFWIDLAADNGIRNLRTQVGGGGPGRIFTVKRTERAIRIVRKILDKVLPYALERNVKIGIETHWGFSSYPPFLDALTEEYKNTEEGKALGIIFDWGNFHTLKARYAALEIAARPYNHCHNHVKFFHFGDNFQQTEDPSDQRFRYDSMKIVRTFAENNFRDFFSIEYEGSEKAIVGVYKSVYGLKYAISNGKIKVNTGFEPMRLLEDL